MVLPAEVAAVAGVFLLKLLLGLVELSLAVFVVGVVSVLIVVLAVGLI